MKGTIAITGVWADQAARQTDKRNKQVTFRNSPPFTDCISEINTTQVDIEKDLDVVMPMWWRCDVDLIEYSNNYAKTPGSLWQYNKDDQNDNVTDSESFKFKARITGRTPLLVTSRCWNSCATEILQ